MTYLLIAMICAGCESALPGQPGDLGGGLGDQAGLGCSPSGYSCDPWSTHLYMASTSKRQGSNLRLRLTHNPDNEGAIDDFRIPPEHDYPQLLTVDIPLTTEVKEFLCVAFAPENLPASFDATVSGFLDQVDTSTFTLLNDDLTGSPRLSNLLDICGPTLSAVVAPAIARNGRPALSDVALAIPLSPRPTGFQIGTVFDGWLARGILFVDEQAEMLPRLTATVVAVQ